MTSITTSYLTDLSAASTTGWSTDFSAWLRAKVPSSSVVSDWVGEPSERTVIFSLASIFKKKKQQHLLHYVNQQQFTESLTLGQVCKINK